MASNMAPYMSGSQVDGNRGQGNLEFIHTSVKDFEPTSFHSNERGFVTNEPNIGPTGTPLNYRPVLQATDVAEDEVKPVHLVTAPKQSGQCQSTPATIDQTTMPKVGIRGKRAAPYTLAGNEKHPRKRQRKDSTAHPVPSASTANEGDMSIDAIDGAMRIALYWPIDRAVKFFLMGILKDALLEDVFLRGKLELRVDKETKEHRDEQKNQQDSQAQPLEPFKLDLTNVKEDMTHNRAELAKVGAAELSMVMRAFKPKYHPNEDPYMASYFRHSLPPAKLRGWLDKDEMALRKPIKQEKLDD